MSLHNVHCVMVSPLCTSLYEVTKYLWKYPPNCLWYPACSPTLNLLFCIIYSANNATPWSILWVIRLKSHFDPLRCLFPLLFVGVIHEFSVFSPSECWSWHCVLFPFCFVFVPCNHFNDGSECDSIRLKWQCVLDIHSVWLSKLRCL